MRAAVSVIVPVYNGEKTIERCISSIQNQTLENIEIIVVNDGSADRTDEILSGIHDRRLQVISQPNSGQGFARNAGLAAADGKYAAFVDADDTIEPRMLEVMYERAEETEADVVQCNITDIYSDGKSRVQLSCEDATACVDDSYADRYFAVCSHSYEVCNKLISLDVIKNGGVLFRDTKRYFSEDLLFNIELIARIRKVSFIAEPYYNYYKHEDSHFHSDPAARLKAICTLFEDYINNADKRIGDSVSYTAAMLIIYNAGFCISVNRGEAEAVLSGELLKRCIRSALRRRYCKIKHRLYLFIILAAPKPVKIYFAEKYSGRWRV